jgi:hypothetical protein
MQRSRNNLKAKAKPLHNFLEDGFVKKKNTKDNSIKRLCLIAATCFFSSVVMGALVLCYYFAPKKIQARVITVPDLVGVCEDSMSVPEGIVI